MAGFFASPLPLAFAGRTSAVLLLAANLIPLIGVFAWGWNAGDIMLLFWCENLIIGVMNALRIVLWGVMYHKWYAWPMAAFFTVHYGIFTAVHGVFVVQFFLPHAPGMGMAAPLGEWLHTDGIPVAILGLVGSHFFSLLSNYLGRGEIRRMTPQTLMTAPYGRVTVLHLTILVAGFLVMLTKDARWALVLLTLLKTVIDLRAHLKEHREPAGTPAAS